MRSQHTTHQKEATVTKKVWTGSYHKARGLPACKWYGISRGRPQWWTRPVETIRALCPSSELLERSKMDPTWDWKTAFRKELEARDLDKVYAMLPDECVLLCYETEWEGCHRKIVFEVLQARYGVEGGEWFRRGA